jgi:hypothetical protein
MAWNTEHCGVAAAPLAAIDWSVSAMTKAAGRLATVARGGGRLTTSYAHGLCRTVFTDQFPAGN